MRFNRVSHAAAQIAEDMRGPSLINNRHLISSQLTTYLIQLVWMMDFLVVRLICAEQNVVSHFAHIAFRHHIWWTPFAMKGRIQISVTKKRDNCLCHFLLFNMSIRNPNRGDMESTYLVSRLIGQWFVWSLTRHLCGRLIIFYTIFNIQHLVSSLGEKTIRQPDCTINS